jgi:hypothetical protein
VSAPEPVGTPAASMGGRRAMTFRRRRNSPLPTSEELRRQGVVVRSAWRHFGESEALIAFLNTRHDALDRQPLHLAIESDEGLMRVEKLLEGMVLRA